MKREIKKAEGLQFIEYTPEGKPKGIILFLHGAGETAQKGPIDIIERNDMPKQLVASATGKSSFNPQYVIIAPQANSWGKNQLIAAFKILDSYGIQEKHVTGLSMGGLGTYAAAKFAAEDPSRGNTYFKTVGAVCGRTSTDNIEAFEKVALKIWHADNDPTVAVGPDRQLFAILQSKRYDVEYKEYIGKGHAIWDEAYNPNDSDGYWQWLERKTAPVPQYQNVTVQIDEQNLKAVFTTEAGIKFYADVTK